MTPKNFSPFAFVLTIALAVGVVGFGQAVTQAAGAPDIERMRDSTVLVTVELKGTAAGHGSGVLVDEGVLTAAHVVNGVTPPARVVVGFRGGEFVHADVERIEYLIDEKTSFPLTDLALLHIPTDSGYPRAAVSCSPASVGDRVFVSGHPGAVRWAVTRGHVISDTPRAGGGPAGRWLQTDAVMAGGNSGGPIFNTGGSVTGVVAHGQVSGFARIPTGHGFGNSGAVICDFLRRGVAQNAGA